jgi:hypothetical protein
MVGSLLVSLAALLVAVFGCAWLKPVGLKMDQSPEATRPLRRQAVLAADDGLPEQQASGR